MKVFVIALLISFSFFLACKKEPCLSEKIGTIKTDLLSPSLLKLKGNEKLIFKDANGIERIFAAEGRRTQTVEVEAGKKCTSGSFESTSSSFYFYEADGFFMNYVDTKSPDDIIHYSLGTYSADPNKKDTVFMDLLHIDIVDKANSQNVHFLLSPSPASIDNGIRIVASKRGYKGKYSLYNFDNTPFTQDKIVINGKTLSNVIKLKTTFLNTQYTIYVSSPNGIVAFTDEKGASWVLDRIE